MPARASRLVFWLARLVSVVFYRIERAGELVPDGPVLLVVNHPNALLDPAIVWATAGRDVRVLAKSTLFRRHIMSPIVRRSGAIPVYRRIDEGVDPSRNVETFAAVAGALASGGCVCVFPEGITHPKGKLEPLRTGAARMALDAETRGVRVAIVPVGLNFDRRTTFRSRVTIVYGKPFFAGELVDQARQDAAAAVRALTDRIGSALRRLVVEADPGTDAALLERVDRLYTTARSASRDPLDRVQRRRVIAVGMERLRAADPSRYEAIRDRLADYDARLRRYGLRDRDLDWTASWRASLSFAVQELALGIVLVPIAALGVGLFAVPYFATGAATKRFAEDLSTHASVEAVGGALIYGLWVALLAAAVGARWGWPAGAIVFVVLPIFAVAALAAFEREARAVSVVRAWLAIRRMPAWARHTLARQRAGIAEVLDEVYEWLRR